MLIHLLIAAAVQNAVIVPQPGAVAVSEVANGPMLTAPPATTSIILPKGTMLRLMVLNEVNSRDHQTGHRFVLRVDEDVIVDGVKVIPIGAKGWGEVVSSEGTSSLGKSGRLNARLLYVEANGQQVPVTGERETAGSGGTAQVVGGVLGFGLLGLLMKGNNASLKAGEILNGYMSSDTAFNLPVPPTAL